MTHRLNNMLEKYTEEVRRLFNADLTGIYLTGSVALDGFHEGKSDVDCTVLLKMPPDANQVKMIEKIHRNIALRYRKIPLECQYITCDCIGKGGEDIQPFYSYHDRKLTLGKFNANEVTWFTLKKYGITVTGMPVAEMNIPTSIGEVQTYVKGNVGTYWKNWLNRIRKPFSLRRIFALTDKAVEWGVCGITRMYYTLSENDIASKDKAAEYGLENLPTFTHKILKEALRIRKSGKHSQYRSRFQRRKDMIDYMQYLIEIIEKLPAA